MHLKYKMFGTKKKIKIKALEHDNDESVIQHDDKHYEYKVDGNKKKNIQTTVKNYKVME